MKSILAKRTKQMREIIFVSLKFFSYSKGVNNYLFLESWHFFLFSPQAIYSFSISLALSIFNSWKDSPPHFSLILSLSLYLPCFLSLSLTRYVFLWLSFSFIVLLCFPISFPLVCQVGKLLVLYGAFLPLKPIVNIFFHFEASKAFDQSKIQISAHLLLTLHEW